MARTLVIAAVALGGMSVWLTAAQPQGGAANQIAIDFKKEPPTSKWGQRPCEIPEPPVPKSR